ncbi:MAG TPA: hypothetical protein VE377_25605 [Candidatus Dormibacteraeota bacterium]|nr:hypothetical protein [Candidatus Dormibacteraeota bacterium]
MTTNRRFRSIYIIAWSVAFLMISNANPQSNVCVTSIGGLGASTPNLDGVVSGDFGWNNATQLNLSGTLGADVGTKALLGTDGTNLWVGLVVDAPAIDPETTFVLAFSANDGHPENDWRLHIRPFSQTGQTNPDKTPKQVLYWRNSTSTNGGLIPWNNVGASPNPTSGANWEDSPNNIQVTTNGNHWELEFKIPIIGTSSTGTYPNDPGFCPSCNPAVPSTFKLYLNVLNTMSSAVATFPPEWVSGNSYTSGQQVIYQAELYKCSQATCAGNTPPPAGGLWTFVSLASAVGQDVWPPCPAGTVCPSIYSPATPTDISHLTPDPSLWGTGALWTSGANPPIACTGVSLQAYTSPLQVGIGADPNNLTQTIGADINDVTEGSIGACPANDDYVPPGAFTSPINTFVAIPRNSMSNPAKVSVMFRLADFGIPGVDQTTGLFPPLGSPVPAGCDPNLGPTHQCDGVKNNSTNELTIPAFGAQTPGQPSTTVFNSTTWQMNYKQTCLFKFGFIYNGKPHQCVQVVMESTDAATQLLNRSTEENLDFQQASTFTKRAFVNGSQGNVPSPTRFLLVVETDEDGPLGVTPPPTTRGGTTVGGQNLSGAPKAVLSSSAEPKVPRFRNQDLAAITRQQISPNVTNMYQWIVRGYVYAGPRIIIDGHEYEYVKRAGDFGYMAGHTGETLGWKYKFQGSNLEQVTPYLYTVLVDPGTKTAVDTTITAETLSKFAVFADFGAAIPQGTFGNAFNKGFSFNAGAEYMFTPQVSAEGIFGIHHFPGILVSNENVYQFSANLKVYLNSHWPFKPFVNGGIGGYKFSPGDPYVGGNFGGGALWPFPNNPHWGVQGSYNFHVVNTPTAASKFSTVQGGIRYVF